MHDHEAKVGALARASGTDESQAAMALLALLAMTIPPSMLPQLTRMVTTPHIADRDEFQDPPADGSRAHSRLDRRELIPHSEDARSWWVGRPCVAVHREQRRSRPVEVLHVWESMNVVVCKRSVNTGCAGVQHLYSTVTGVRCCSGRRRIRSRVRFAVLPVDRTRPTPPPIEGPE